MKQAFSETAAGTLTISGMLHSSQCSVEHS